MATAVMLVLAASVQKKVYPFVSCARRVIILSQGPEKSVFAGLVQRSSLCESNLVRHHAVGIGRENRLTQSNAIVVADHCAGPPDDLQTLKRL